MSSYQYAIRYKEKDAIGQVSNTYDFAEWSCGCPRVYGTSSEVEELARNWCEDVAEGLCDYMTNIEVVRRLVPEWEVVDQTAVNLT